MVRRQQAHPSLRSTTFNAWPKRFRSSGLSVLLGLVLVACGQTTKPPPTQQTPSPTSRISSGMTRILGNNITTLAVHSDTCAVLAPGAVLSQGQRITTCNGDYFLVMQTDGNAVVYDRNGRPQWDSGTWGQPGDRLIMQTDGNLVLYTADGKPLWSSRSDQHPGAALAIQPDGSLVVHSGDTVYWSGSYSTLPSGATLATDFALFSPDRSHFLLMQSDGNLVSYTSAGQLIWASNTDQTSGRQVSMQQDGNLVISSPSGALIWQTDTAGSPDAALKLHNSGDLAIYQDANAIWTSAGFKTGNHGLQTAYFTTPDLSGTPKTTLSATADFNWGPSFPASNITSGRYSVQWTGKIEPKYSEAYTFLTTANGGVRLKVNGQLLTDRWSDSGHDTTDSSSITLQAGQKYDLELDFLQTNQDANIKLEWQSASQVRGVVPGGALYPAPAGGQINPNEVSNPSAEVAFPNPIVGIGGLTTFDASDFNAQQYAWTFDDGGTATDAYVEHTFTTPGKHTATLSMTLYGGQTLTKTVAVGVLPEIQDIVSKRATSDSMTVHFDAGSPIDGVSYAFDLGDGTTETRPQFDHTYPKLGTYDYTLTVRDTRPATLTGQGLQAQGLRAQDTSMAPLLYKQTSFQTIWRKAPVAKLSMNSPNGNGTAVAIGKYPFTVTFDASASSDTNTGETAGPLTYNWNFGDGSAPLVNGGSTTSHQYIKQGRFPVTLLVSNKYGLSDVYRTFVHSRDIKSGIRLNVEYRPSQTQSINDGGISAQSLRVQDTSIETYTDYLPYVLGTKNAITNGRAYVLDENGNRTNSLCNQITGYVNGKAFPVDGYLLNSYPDGFCNGLLFGDYLLGRLPAQTINEILVTNSRYLNTEQVSVFEGLSIPRVVMAIYPDEFLPGDQASPIINQNTYLNPVTGKAEWIMMVRVRESELQGTLASGIAKMHFKVPIQAIDADGKMITTVNGRFKASFVNSNIESNCGDCNMVNGLASIDVTLPVNAFTLDKGGVDLSRIILNNDSPSGCDSENSVYGNYLIKGCTVINTTNVYPTGNAPMIEPFKYPLNNPEKFFNHFTYGTTASQVRVWREWLSKGVYADIKNMAIYSIPLYGSSKFCYEQMNYYYNDGRATFDNVAATMLGCVGFAAETGVIANITVNAAKNIAKVHSYAVGAGADAALAKNVIQDPIRQSLNAGDDAAALMSRIENSMGKEVYQEIADCAIQCIIKNDALSAPKTLPLEGLRTSLNQLVTRYQAANLTIEQMEVNIKRIFDRTRPATFATSFDHHVFEGEIGPDFQDPSKLTPQGMHYAPGADPTKVLITKPSKPNAFGVYKATVEMYDSSLKPLKKDGGSTFWPDSFTKDQVRQAVSEAFASRTTSALNGIVLKWEGMSASGIKVQGFMDDFGNIITAFPKR